MSKESAIYGIETTMKAMEILMKNYDKNSGEYESLKDQIEICKQQLDKINNTEFNFSEGDKVTFEYTADIGLNIKGKGTIKDIDYISEEIRVNNPS